MDMWSRETAQAALTGIVAAALCQTTRRSAHPADQKALRRAATRIAIALDAEFVVAPRHSSAAERTDRLQLSELNAAAHE